MSGIIIQKCTSIDQVGWLALRQSLWPHCTREEHLSEMASFCAAAPKRYAQFIAYSASGAVIGLIEAAVRSDYVNGTQFSPVMFLEGLYVIPEARRNGVARKLVEEVERWARESGCREIASDASSENHLSHIVHRALGFEETERVVFFRKSLR